MPDRPSVETFLEQRGEEVLSRSVDALSTSSLEELAALCHRLAGTLGIFGRDEAARLVRRLEQYTESADCGPEEIARHRTATVTALRAMTGSKASGAPR